MTVGLGAFQMKSKARIIRRYLLVYLVVFICLVTLLIPGYIILRKEVRTSFLSSSEAVLSNGAASFEQDLKNAQVISRKIIDSSVIQYLRRLDGSITPRDSFYVLKGLELYNAVTSPIASDAESGLFLQNGSVLFENMFFETPSKFDTSYFSTSDGNDFFSWLTGIKKDNDSYSLTSHSLSTFIGGTREVIAFCQQLPISSYWENSVFFTLYNTDSIIKYMALPDTLIHSNLVIETDQGMVIASTENVSSNTTTINVSSPTYGFNVALSIDDAFITESLNSWLRYVIVFLGLYVLAGIILIVLIVYHSLKPVINALDSTQDLYNDFGGNIPQRSANVNEYFDQFLSYVRTTLSHNKELLLVQKESLIASRVELMLNGLLPEYDTLSTEILSKLPESWRMVLLRFLHVDAWTASQVSELQVYIKSVISGEDDVKLAHFSSTNLVMIMPDSENGELSAEIAKKISNAVMNYAQVESQCVISMPCGSNGISYAYSILKTRISLMGNETPGLFVYTSDPSMGDTAIQTSVQTLYDILLKGDLQAFKECILADQQRLRSLQDTDPHSLAEFFFMYRHVIAKANDDLNAGIDIIEYRENDSIDENVSRLTEYAESVCEFACSYNKHNIDDFEKKILNYIDSHLSSSELCVQSIIDEFSISATSLQRMMHRLVGKSFLEYVDEARMQKAYKSITESDRSLKDIAVDCGYANFNTFYKAFKRRYGCSPGSIRQGESS